jgi:hypothetical protein
MPWPEPHVQPSLSKKYSKKSELLAQINQAPDAKYILKNKPKKQKTTPQTTPTPQKINLEAIF